ncbi:MULTISPECIES: hypothetical protein [Natrialbaceae]|nr:hypothetical protein [Natronococcus sp. CG52]
MQFAYARVYLEYRPVSVRSDDRGGDSRDDGTRTGSDDAHW